MAILSGQAARDWIAQNPSSRFTDMTTGQVYNAPQAQQQPQQQRGFLTNLGLGISKPFRQGLGILGEFGGTIGDLVKTAQGRHSEVGQDGFRDLFNIALTEEEEEQLRRDPLKMGLKSGAGVASYGIGGGVKAPLSAATTLGRMGQAGLRAVPAGLVGGFGYSEEGEELEGTLKGGAFGFGAGAALQGVGEAAQALKKTGQRWQSNAQKKIQELNRYDDELLRNEQLYLNELDDQILARQQMQGLAQDETYLKELQRQIQNTDPALLDDVLPITDNMLKKLGYSPNEIAQKKAFVLKDMADKGFTIGAADDIANQWDDWYQTLLKEKGAVVEQVGSQVAPGSSSVSKAMKRMQNILKTENDLTRMIDDGLEQIVGKGTNMGTVPKDLTVGQVTKIKEMVDQLGGGVSSLLDPSAKVSSQLLTDIRHASREIISGVDPLDDILNKMTDAASMKPAVYEAPIVSANMADKSARVLGGLELKGAREATRMAEKNATFLQTNQRTLETLAQKKAKAAADFAQTANQLQRANKMDVRLGSGILPFGVSPIPTNVDVRAPFVGVQNAAGTALGAIPAEGIQKAASLGQRAIPGMIGAASSMPERAPEQGGQDVSGIGMEQMGGGYSVGQALQEAYQIMPNASESEIMSLAKMLMSEQSGGGPQATAQAISNAKSGLDSLNKLENLLSEKSGLLTSQLLGKGDVASFIGGKDYQNYQTWAYNVADLLLRMRTGAQANESEIKMYMDDFMPKWYESDEAKQAKISQIKQSFLNVLQGGGSVPQEQSISDQYEQF
jgi:hypothetical protein